MLVFTPGGDEHAHADAGALELVAQRLREADDRVLGRAVGTEAGVATKLAPEPVLTMWPSPCSIMRGTKLRMPFATPRTLTPSSRLPFVVGEVPDATGGGDAGVVAEQVHRAERVEGEVGERLHARGVRHVDGPGDRGPGRELGGDGGRPAPR